MGRAGNLGRPQRRADPDRRGAGAGVAEKVAGEAMSRRFYQMNKSKTGTFPAEGQENTGTPRPGNMVLNTIPDMEIRKHSGHGSKNN